MSDITTNAIQLGDANTRVSYWEDRIGATLQPAPVSILIPIRDLQDIVTNVQNVRPHLTVTHARLYLTFTDQAGSNSITGILVPFGGSIEVTPTDIIFDVNDPAKPPTSESFVTAYDFTMPCPPLGCEGSYFPKPQ